MVGLDRRRGQDLAGQDHRADADQRIAWTATDGAKNAGVVTFHRLDDGKCRVALRLDVQPDAPIESAGDALGFVQRRTKGDLERFKKFIEERGVATGAWRGAVKQDATN